MYAVTCAELVGSVYWMSSYRTRCGGGGGGGGGGRGSGGGGKGGEGGEGKRMRKISGLLFCEVVAKQMKQKRNVVTLNVCSREDYFNFPILFCLSFSPCAFSLISLGLHFSRILR